MSGELVLGAVCHGPWMVTIWEGMKRYFCTRGLPFDYILYSNYDRQVDALLGGQIDVAWNSPLAWVQARRLAAENDVALQPVAMRDTDCGLRSVIVVREDSSITGLDALRGKVVAVGDTDSAEATLLPLSLMHTATTPAASGPPREH
jgi:ABC-type phosphate/phosphonate transport system substrate-binding protein